MTDDRPAAAPRTNAGQRVYAELADKAWLADICAIEDEAYDIGSLEAARPTPEPAPADLPSVEAVRQVLNDYDTFVAFREDDGSKVTVKDRHDWAERWVTRRASSRGAPSDENGGTP